MIFITITVISNGKIAPFIQYTNGIIECQQKNDQVKKRFFDPLLRRPGSS
jgi:hypothetical protein